jgi:O-methyltransferase
MVKEKVKQILNPALKSLYKRRAMYFPTFSSQLHESILLNGDYFRYATIGLAVQRILSEDIAGSFAEAGVYRGDMSKFIHQIAPERQFFLFDTFEGFDKEDLGGSDDFRFKDTSVDIVLQNIGESKNIDIRKGFVPMSFQGLDKEKFAFVLLDLDKYKPTVASLEFFYPRLSEGAYLIVHDFNSPESDWACNRALNEFMQDKPEKIIEIADIYGTAMIRKI